MDKKELTEFIDKEISGKAGQIQFCGRAGYHREDIEKQIEILSEIRRLIESSGERTVSRETAWGWVHNLLNAATDASLPLDEIFTGLLKILSELGVEVKP